MPSQSGFSCGKDGAENEKYKFTDNLGLKIIAVILRRSYGLLL